MILTFFFKVYYFQLFNDFDILISKCKHLHAQPTNYDPPRPISLSNYDFASQESLLQ